MPYDPLDLAMLVYWDNDNWLEPSSELKEDFISKMYEEAPGCWHQFYTLLPFGALSTNLPTSSLDRSVGGNCCNLPKNSLIRSFFFVFTDLPAEYPRNVASKLPTGAAARWSCMAWEHLWGSSEVGKEQLPGVRRVPPGRIGQAPHPCCQYLCLSFHQIFKAFRKISAETLTVY